MCIWSRISRSNYKFPAKMGSMHPQDTNYDGRRFPQHKVLAAHYTKQCSSYTFFALCSENSLHAAYFPLSSYAPSHLFPFLCSLKLKCIFQARPFLIFVTEKEFLPIQQIDICRSIPWILTSDPRSYHANLRIIPSNTTFISRMIKIRAFITEHCFIRERQ